MIEQIYETVEFMKRFQTSEKRKANTFIVSVKNMPIHMHDGIELMYVLKGELEIRISFNHYRLKAGDFLLVNPYEVHRIEAQETTEVLFLQMDQNLFEGKAFVFDPYFYRTYNQDVILEIKESMAVFYLLSDEKRRKLEGRRILKKIADLCDRFFQAHQYDANRKEKSSCIESKVGKRRIQDIYEYLYGSYHKKLKLSDVADSQHIDMFYTSRLIKDGMGTTFQNALNIVRTDRAEVFLLGSDLPIQQVSEMVGFSSHAYFVKQFKNLFHLSPSAYRKKYKKRTYPIQKMEYKRMFYDRIALKNRIRAVEFDSRDQSEDRRLSVLQEALEHAVDLCLNIKESELENEELKVIQNGSKIKIRMKSKECTIVIDNKKR